MKTGKLDYNYQTKRVGLLTNEDLFDYDFHCGDCFQIRINGNWQDTRIESKRFNVLSYRNRYTNRRTVWKSYSYIIIKQERSGIIKPLLFICLSYYFHLLLNCNFTALTTLSDKYYYYLTTIVLKAIYGTNWYTQYHIATNIINFLAYLLFLDFPSLLLPYFQWHT